MTKLIGKKVVVYKRDEQGNKTDEVLVKGNFQGSVDVLYVNKFTNQSTSYTAGSVYDGKNIHAVDFPLIDFV